MNITTSTERTTSASERSPSSSSIAREAQARSVEGIHQSTGFHWVGNGFFVSTYFPSEELPAERVSPFLLMDYGPVRTFAPLPHGKRGSAGTRIAASRP